MTKTNLIGAAALLFVATAAGAQEQAAPASATQAKKICKTDRTTGSLTRRTRVCLTQSQWDQLADDTNRSFADIQRDGNQATLQRETGLLPGGGGW